jgi:glycosyltransferase involved in cell wall biosynthesis
MTDVQSAILGPITRALKVKHYLWYAHKYPSKFLLVASKFVDGIVTSTEGSCPINSENVFRIGQGINLDNFQATIEKQEFRIQNLVHVGRFDSSKNISLLMGVARDLRASHPDLTFTQIGSPSTPVAEEYFQKTKLMFKADLDEGWLQVRGSIKRIDLPSELGNFDVFLHAYAGSLDKTLIEATLSGLPVVTINEEYLKEFGRWNKVGDFSLKSEILFLDSITLEELNMELTRRFQIAQKRHSLDGWIGSLGSIFLSEMKGRR